MLPLPSCPLPPPLPAPSPVFQQLEVDYTLAAPHPTYYPTDLREVGGWAVRQGGALAGARGSWQ